MTDDNRMPDILLDITDSTVESRIFIDMTDSSDDTSSNRYTWSAGSIYVEPYLKISDFPFTTI